MLTHRKVIQIASGDMFPRLTIFDGRVMKTSKNIYPNRSTDQSKLWDCLDKKGLGELFIARNYYIKIFCSVREFEVKGYA